MGTYKGQIDSVENLTVEEDILVVNVNGKIFDIIGEIEDIELPEEGTEISTGEEVASISGSEGDVHLRAPISGIVLEVNDLFQEHIKKTHGHAELTEWLVKIEPQDPEDLLKFEE